HAEAGVIDEDGIALLEEALRGYDEDHLVAIQLRARLVDALQFAGQPARREALSEEALAMADRLGDPRGRVAALESRHGVLMHIDHVDERLRLSEELLALAKQVGE